MSYNKPCFERVGSFKNSTMGLWTGKFRDIFGGKAIIKITISF